MKRKNPKGGGAASAAPPAGAPTVDTTAKALGFITVEIEHINELELSEEDRERLKEFAPLFGTKTTVDIRAIPASRIRAFSMVLDNEARAVEMYCQKPEGWADTLTAESLNLVADTGLELNASFYRAWYLRQAKWRETQKPEAIAKLEETLRQTIENLRNQSGSASSSPKSEHSSDGSPPK